MRYPETRCRRGPAACGQPRPPLRTRCGCSSVVERQLPKLYVVGSIPITRSSFPEKSVCYRAAAGRERLPRRSRGRSGCRALRPGGCGIGCPDLHTGPPEAFRPVRHRRRAPCPPGGTEMVAGIANRRFAVRLLRLLHREPGAAPVHHNASELAGLRNRRHRGALIGRKDYFPRGSPPRMGSAQRPNGQ